MNKFLSLFALLFILTGCGNEQSVYIINHDAVSMRFLDNEGTVIEGLTFEGYQSVTNKGYFIYKENGKKCAYVDRDANIVIDYDEYDSLVLFEEILIASNKGKDTIYNANGEIIYQEKEDVIITLTSKHPIIQKGDEYFILDGKGNTLLKSKNKIINITSEENMIFVQYKEYTELYETSPQLNLLNGKLDKNMILIDTSKTAGELLYNIGENIIYHYFQGEMIFEFPIKNESLQINERTLFFDEGDNIILVNENGETSIYDEEKGFDTIVTTYYQNKDKYIHKNKKSLFGPHEFVDGKDKVEVSHIQFDPLADYNHSDIIPVFESGKGFVYMNYQGQRQFDQEFDSATAFNKNGVAIVCKDDKYYLLDEKGKTLSDKYQNIEVNGDYYQAYINDNEYYLLNEFGEIVIEKTSVFDVNISPTVETTYAIFFNGDRGSVYDLATKEEVFSAQGELFLREGKYFVSSDNKIYDLNGKEVF